MLNREAITYETVQKDRNRIKNIESLPNIKIRRDKFHAHFDRQYFFDRKKLGEETPLKWSDMEQMIKTMIDVFNDYSVAYDGIAYSFEPQM